MSAYNFEVADTDALFDLFRKAAAECERCLEAKLPIPAYEQAIKASHVFNTLQARGVISVAERQAYIGRVRDLAKARLRRVAGATGRADGRLPARAAVARKSRRGCRRRRATILRGCSPNALSEAGLATGAIDVYSTPRRLALIARDVADATEASREELKGPRTSRAAAGARRLPAQDRADAATSSRSATASVSRSSSGPGGRRREILAETIERIVADFPWPKSMRWGDGDAALGAAAARHRRHARRGDRAGRDRRHRQRRDDRRPPLPPSRADHHRRRRATMSRSCAPATSSSTRTSASG